MAEEQSTSWNRSSVDTQSIRHGQKEVTGTTILGIKLQEYIVVAVDSTYFEVCDSSPKLWGLCTNLVGAFAGYAPYCLEALQKEERKQNHFSTLKDAAKRLEEIACSIEFLSHENENLIAQIILAGFDESQKPQLLGISIDKHFNMVFDCNHLAGGSGSVYAAPILDGGYNPTMSADDGVELARKAMHWAVTNDIHTRRDVTICLVSPWDSMVVWAGDVMAYYKPDYTLADFRYNVYDGGMEDHVEAMDADD